MGQKVDLIFCLTGNPSSAKQALAVNVAMFDLAMAQKQVGIRHASSCNIYSVRTGCLTNANNGYRKNQKPMEGIYDDYKYLVWIDSDNIITAQDINKLIAHDVDICAAWYRQYSGGDLNDTNKASCGYAAWGPDIYTTKSLLMGDIPKMPVNEKGLIEVDFSGMGLMVVKKGVFESLSYPWFDGPTVEWEEGGVQMARMITDDEGFCMKAKAKGFKIWIDPNVRIPHEKEVLV